ncbi:GNAT family N-acetyltransferase [Filimonas effusa]|uniref:GNAT family N-acetyltransferase n=1 Tax=Filimonas effusa TaxID=2508721 RepID=A0A4Q1D380_9BACT|nr:GNAT family N-acetyltransferase [Filimonas effusa]RXK82862.1 GNAT family N-acetyltransferase [Filimonas effusa]
MKSEDFQIAPYQEVFRDQMVSVWEQSVRTTHDFLLEEDLQEIKSFVKEIDFYALQVYCLLYNNSVVGFIGVATDKVEMLFLSPDCIGLGLGKWLMHFAIEQLGACKVDVNEQNKKALAFYNKLGFEPYERSALDDQGKAYPLLRMALKRM